MCNFLTTKVQHTLMRLYSAAEVESCFLTRCMIASKKTPEFRHDWIDYL